MPTTLPRHILLLPLLFLLGFLYPWQAQHHASYNDYTITQGQNDVTQQWASAIIGAVAGGGTGATTALQGEKYNRQLHQQEIKWLKDHALAFAKKLYGDNPIPEQIADAQARLTQQALRGVDKGWSLKLGSKTDQAAKAFLDTNDAHLFEVKDEYEFKDGSTDGQREISSYSQKEFDDLNNFYQNNVHRPTTTNPEGSTKFANEEWANEKGLIDALKEGKITQEQFNQAIRDFVPNTVDSIKNIPNTINSAGNYLDAVAPTTNQNRLDTLYGSHTDGSVLQANMATSDAITTAGMATGAGGVARGAVRGIDKSLTKDLDIKVNPLDGKESDYPFRKLNGDDTRDVYKDWVDSIDTDVAHTEENARKISNQRAEYKKDARELMKDEDAAKNLPPVQDFEYYKNKYSNPPYNHQGDELWKAIINGSKRTNPEYNTKYGNKKR